MFYSRDTNNKIKKLNERLLDLDMIINLSLFFTKICRFSVENYTKFKTTCLKPVSAICLHEIMLIMRETHKTFQWPLLFLLLLLLFFFQDFGIENRYSWFWEFLNIADWECEFSFFRGIYLRIEIRIISIFSRPRINKLCKKIYVEEFTHLRPIQVGADDVIVSRSYDLE